MRFRKILVLARLVAGATAMVLPAAPLLLAAQPALAQESYVFSSINVTGNQRIEGETIRIFAGVPTGTAVSSTDLNAALDKLFSTGLFADASLVPDGATLIIRVVENPTVNKINFEGNNKIKDDVLSAAIEMQPRGPYSRAAAEQAAQVIADVYRAEGRYDATVRPLLIEQSDNRVDVVFEISEGAATGVSRINFIGNNAYSDRRLLGVITTTESGILRNLFSSDIFDAQQMQSDMDLLTDFYLERGFADFEIQSSVAELTRDRENFYITYDIYEGPAYTINSVSVSSTVNGLSPDGFTGQNLVQVGGLYSADDIAAAIEELENEVALRKFSFIQARPVLTRNDVAETIDVQFVLEQGPRVFVERIDITGNSATLDRVIRREFTLAEGDPFSARKIREAEENIDALGYFSVVDVGIVPGSSENQAVVSVNAVDQSTGSISFGFTYSAEDGIGGSVILNERNFLGRGQRLNFELGIAQTRSVLAFGFTEPALLDRDLLAGFDVYYRDFDQTASSYQTTNIGLRTTDQLSAVGEWPVVAALPPVE